MPLETKKQQRQRDLRSSQNRRGREKPARVPAKLTRTSAFVPKRQGLITDRKFECTYVVPGGSVVTVRGGELGTQHRDVLYAVMRLKAKEGLMTNPDYDPSSRDIVNRIRTTSFYSVQTTWRELTELLGNTPHKNNLRTLLHLLEDLKQVSMRVERGTLEEVMEAKEKNQLVGPGRSSNVIYDIKWSGKNLDDNLTITYGAYVREAMQTNYMVSLNAEVQFKLKNDHAKTFWPYVDSQVRHTWVDEQRLSELAGRNLWGEDSKMRNNFRVTCRKAFEDMVNAGGLLKFEIEVRGAGRKKTRRYHYKHALARQIELQLDNAG
ncbi:MAG: hypothetical protein KZQ84_19410 [Candidatus Thiodiazotropha sp. (ex Lucinoma borealis)]|nr:hypothetical protein [Candidatus Thiodiazotropha sp. (ex Lucinoma borealis)]